MDYRQEKRPRNRLGRAFLAGSSPLQYERWISCPYCGEAFISIVDGSAGDQSYYEDCEICCRPILFQVITDGEGNITDLSTLREDD